MTVVLPAYNSADFIVLSVQLLLDFYDQAGLKGEVIVVDDGSSDETSSRVPQDRRVKVLSFKTNRGKGAALRTGMAAATGHVRIFTDADVPYGTEPMLAAYRQIMERGYHAVIGDRTLPGSRYGHAGMLRRWISGFGGFIFRTLVTGGVYDTQCGFKAFRHDVAREIFQLSCIDRFAVDVELIYLLLKYRLDIKRIPVCLRIHTPSTVRVIPDTMRAVRDVARLRFNWVRGRYNSPTLFQLHEQEFQKDTVDSPGSSPDVHERIDSGADG
jgi:dolichyl-phosphate beta-glucosyltransferase